MDPTLKAIVYAIAIVLWVLAAFQPPQIGRWNLVAAGLAVFAVPFLVDAIDAA